MRTDRIDGGVTAPHGFRASGLHCGIKATGRPDLALLVSDVPASAAAIFTLNQAKAAPVLVSQAQLAAGGGSMRAIVTNSGCANACTGAQGMADARAMVALTAEALACDAAAVLVASTGVIGVNLKMDALATGIPRAAAALSETGGADAARAIMTTDPFPKDAAVEVTTDSVDARGEKVHVGFVLRDKSLMVPIVVGPMEGALIRPPAREQTIEGKTFAITSATRTTEVMAILVAPTFEDLLARRDVREGSEPGTRIEQGTMRVLSPRGEPIGFYAGDVRRADVVQYVEPR